MNRLIGKLLWWLLVFLVLSPLVHWLLPNSVWFWAGVLFAWLVYQDVSLSPEELRRHIADGSWCVLVLFQLLTLGIGFCGIYFVLRRFYPENAIPLAALYTCAGAYLRARQTISYLETPGVRVLEKRTVLLGCLGMAALAHFSYASERHGWLSGIAFGLLTWASWPMYSWSEKLAARLFGGGSQDRSTDENRLRTRAL